MIEFILSNAKRLGIDEMLTSSLTVKGYTPLFMLCQRGYFKKNEKNEYKEHEKRHYYVNMLLLNPKFIEGEDQSNLKKGQKPQEKYLLAWQDQVPQILYTPLHWLAYWNDH